MDEDKSQVAKMVEELQDLRMRRMIAEAIREVVEWTRVIGPKIDQLAGEHKDMEKRISDLEKFKIRFESQKSVLLAVASLLGAFVTYIASHLFAWKFPGK